MDLTKIEFVFVEDCSQDRTYDLLPEKSKADLRVKVVRFPIISDINRSCWKAMSRPKGM